MTLSEGRLKLLGDQRELECVERGSAGPGPEQILYTGSAS